MSATIIKAYRLPNEAKKEPVVLFAKDINYPNKPLSSILHDTHVGRNKDLEIPN